MSRQYFSDPDQSPMLVDDIRRVDVAGQLIKH